MGLYTQAVRRSIREEAWYQASSTGKGTLGRLDFFGALIAYHMCQDTYLRDVSKTTVLWTVLHFLTHIADSIALLLKFDELFRRYDGHFDGGGGRGVR